MLAFFVRYTNAVLTMPKAGTLFPTCGMNFGLQPGTHWYDDLWARLHISVSKSTFWTRFDLEQSNLMPKRFVFWTCNFLTTWDWKLTQDYLTSGPARQLFLNLKKEYKGYFEVHKCYVELADGMVTWIESWDELNPPKVAAVVADGSVWLYLPRSFIWCV